MRASSLAKAGDGLDRVECEQVAQLRQEMDLTAYGASVELG